MKLWDARTGKAIRTFPGDTSFRRVAFSPDGRLIAAGGGKEGEQGVGNVKIWEVRTGRERSPITGHGALGRGVQPRWAVAWPPAAWTRR